MTVQRLLGTAFFAAVVWCASGWQATGEAPPQPPPAEPLPLSWLGELPGHSPLRPKALLTPPSVASTQHRGREADLVLSLHPARVNPRPTGYMAAAG
jgi:hypothetical protein